MDVARLKAIIEADSEKGEAGLKRFHGLIGQSASAMGGLVTGLGALAGATVIGGIALIVSQLGGMVKSGMDANAVTAQTEAVLKSTHGAAGMTAQAIDALSNKYMNLTGIDDDVVKSTENMLLTFTNIGQKTFPQATKTALDMSVALGQDGKTSAIQLGKALNDPIAGISALSRVGVTFDQKQKDLIKTYMAHGDIAKAQGIILAELNKEFGGSAEAAGKANGGIKILTAQFENAKQTIGQALIPVLGQLAAGIAPLVTGFANALPGALNVLGAVIGPIFDLLKWAATEFFTHLQPGIMAVADAFSGMGKTMGSIAWSDVLEPVGLLAGQLGGALSGALKLVAAAFKNIPWLTIGLAIGDTAQAVSKLFTWFNVHLMPVIRTLATVIMTNVVPALGNIWASISANLLPAIGRLWEKLSPVLIPAFQLLGWILQNVVGPALGIVINVISHLIDLIATIIGKIGDFLGVLGNVKDAIGGAFGSIHLPGFAGGGTTSGGAFTAAEEGPELLYRPGVYTAPAGSRIYNARDTRRMLTGGDGGTGGNGNGTTITYNIYPAKEHFGPSELDTLTRRHALLANTGGGY